MLTRNLSTLDGGIKDVNVKIDRMTLKHDIW